MVVVWKLEGPTLSIKSLLIQAPKEMLLKVLSNYTDDETWTPSRNLFVGVRFRGKIMQLFSLRREERKKKKKKKNAGRLIVAFLVTNLLVFIKGCPET